MNYTSTKRIYDLVNRPLWWVILVCLVQGRLESLHNAVDYLNVRLNREIYRKQLRSWELDRKLEEVQKRIGETNASS